MPAGTMIVAPPGITLASRTAPRSEALPSPSSTTPSPGFSSHRSAVVFTSNTPSLVTSQRKVPNTAARA